MPLGSSSLSFREEKLILLYYFINYYHMNHPTGTNSKPGIISKLEATIYSHLSDRPSESHHELTGSQSPNLTVAKRKRDLLVRDEACHTPLIHIWGHGAQKQENVSFEKKKQKMKTSNQIFGKH